MQRLFFVLLFLTSFGLAQSCLTELQTNLSENDLSQTVTGLEAAVYLKQAVSLLEPALPQTTNLPDWFNVDVNSNAYPVAKWLAERNLLSPDWQADSLDTAVWQAMLNSLAGWYDTQQSFSGDLNHQNVTLSLSQLITNVKPNLNPVGVIASAESNNKEVAFWAVIRNDSIYPRLIVYKPNETTVDLNQGVKSALGYLESCAMTVNHYLFAQENVAKNLFLSNLNGEMYIVATEPSLNSSVTRIAEGLETDFLTFQSAETSNLNSYAAVFAGDRIAPTTLMRLLPRIRTNMNPKQILEFALGR